MSQAVSGKIYDRLGIKFGFVFSVVVWSIGAVLHAFATGIGGLSVFRFILGFGEAGNFPGAAKVSAEWFPQKERALAQGIFNSGVALGSIIAPPAIIWLQISYGWKTTFVLTGLHGFIWLIFWLAFYNPRNSHKWLTEQEKNLIEEGEEQPIVSEKSPTTIRKLLTVKSQNAQVKSCDRCQILLSSLMN